MIALDIVLSLAAILLTALGIIGCIVPGLPGPPLNYLAILAMHFTNPDGAFSWFTLIFWFIIAGLVTVLDFVVPALATKKFGGSPQGIWGGIIGLFVGIIFFPPFGIILGPLFGAILGDLLAGKQIQAAFRSGIGSFVGFVAATVLKLTASIIMAIVVVWEIVKVIGKDILEVFGV